MAPRPPMCSTDPGPPGAACPPSATCAEQLTRESLERVLGFRVACYERYLPVFTHKSAVRATGTPSYERYEFVGDAVINFVVAKLLFDMYPAADEGFLTKVRTRLVSGQCLARLSRQLGLHRFVVMSEKSLRLGCHENPRILEDVFESLVGCVYLDLGMLAAKGFLLAVYDRFVNFAEVLRDTNYKDGLMRFAQARGMDLPEYVVTDSSARGFVVEARLAGAVGAGSGPSKKVAEQAAAQCLLKYLGCLKHTGDVNDAHVSRPSSARPDFYARPQHDGPVAGPWP